MDNKTIITVLVIAIILIGGYIAFNTSAAVVSAQGNSVIEAKPDKVSININIEAREDTAQKAKDAHDKILDNLVLNLLKLGIAKDEIKTVNFNIYPEYDWSNGDQKLKGYIASEQIVVETNDFDGVAEIVDASVDAGALVSYINFELSEEKQSEYKTQALEEAGKDAKIKAEATARGLGKNLGSLVSVKSQDFNYGPVVYFESKGGVASSAEARDAAINIAPRDIEVRATIEVEYKLRSF